MIDNSTPPEHAIVELKRIHLNSTAGTLDVDDGRMLVFLCGNCDSVHVVFQFDGQRSQYNINMSDEQAEKMAALLVAPPIIR